MKKLSQNSQEFKETIKITLSIVSHGQGHLVRWVLDDLKKYGVDVSYEIILTLNIPEDESFLKDYSQLPISVIKNTYQKGFGKNHNDAFEKSKGEYFAILNPDIRFQYLKLSKLLKNFKKFKESNIAAVGPKILNPHLKIEDSARKDLTVMRLMKRFFLKKCLRKNLLDYRIQENIEEKKQKPHEVDWLAGIFIIFNRLAFENIKGFDTQYFMYLEDADIARRLRRQNWKIIYDPQVSIVHDAQRASHRNIQYLKWHLTSMIRYLFSL